MHALASRGDWVKTANAALAVSLGSLLVSVWAQINAARARRDAAQARRDADAAAGPQLLLTFDRVSRILYLRNLGQRPAHDVDVQVNRLNSPERSFRWNRASLSAAPSGVTELTRDLTVEQLHGSEVRLAWVDYSGRKFVRSLLGSRDNADGFEARESS
jgi:hypothetical protein